MRLGFVTCVKLGLSCMKAIVDTGVKLELIVTLKDDCARSKSGRIYVDDFASRHGVRVLKIDHVNDAAAVAAFQELDWLFIVGWSQIAGSEVIRAPKRGVLGIHPTLLPQGRGRAAIPWAILRGLDKTGVTLFKLDEGVDTGPVAAQCEIALDDRTTATELYERVNEAHIELIRAVIPALEDGSLSFREQDESVATTWPGRKPEDGAIDLDGSVYDAARLVRAVTRPYPGAYFFNRSHEKTIVWAAEITDVPPDGACLRFQDGYLRILDSEVESLR